MNSRNLLIHEIEIEEAIVGLRADGIGHVFLKDNLELDISVQEKLLEVYDEITN